MQRQLVSTQPERATYYLLGRLRSASVVKRLLLERAEREEVSPEHEILDRKAAGVASAVDAALNFLEDPGRGLNSRLVSRYYGLLHLTIAEQVASPHNNDDLASVQRHTKQGHGLAADELDDDGTHFASRFLVGVLRNGHFWSYAAHRGLQSQLKPFSLDGRPRTNAAWVESLGAGKAVTLEGLFRRVPELGPVVSDFFGQPALSIPIGYSNSNHESAATEMLEAFTSRKSIRPVESADTKPESLVTFVNLLPHEETTTFEFLNSLNLEPLRDITLKPRSSEFFNRQTEVVGTLNHPSPSHKWWDHIPHYRSEHSGTCIIEPTFGCIRQPYVNNLALLYQLSILARYLPDRWNDLARGKLDDLRELCELYLAQLAGVLPLQALDAITGVQHAVHQPGSLHAPI